MVPHHLRLSVLSERICTIQLLSLLLLLELGHHLMLLVLLLRLLLRLLLINEQRCGRWSRLLLWITIDEVKEVVRLRVSCLRLFRLFNQLKKVSDTSRSVAAAQSAANVKYASVEHANVLRER